MLTKEKVMETASFMAFGKPLVINVLRSIIVESIVDAALKKWNWDWCSADYAGWDFEKDEIRLEVKQSAARQSWVTPKPSAGIFDIAPRTGYYGKEGKFVVSAARHAHIYVFAHHPVWEIELADHRDPKQWVFYVVDARQLVIAKQQTIALNSVRAMVSHCTFENLGDSVEQLRETAYDDKAC